MYKLCVFGLMFVFKIGCICWAALFGGIICYINFGDLLKLFFFIGRLYFMESLGGCLCNQSGGLGVLKRLEVSKMLASVHGSPWAVLFASGFLAYSSKCVIHFL